MPHVASARRQFQNVIPVGSNQPTVPADLALAVNALEERTVFVAASLAAASDATTGFEPFTNGMFLIVTGGPNPVLYVRHNDAWKRCFPEITGSAEAPTGGQPGDVHFQW